MLLKKTLITSRLRFITLKSFDTSTEQGRADERYRNASLTMISNVVSKMLAMLVMVLSVKFSIPYLGTERFGIWMTIMSLSTVLTFLDLGMSNALINRVSQSIRKSRQELSNIISGGLGFLFICGLIISSVLIIIAFLIPWQSVIKITDPKLYKELMYSAITFGGLFGVFIFTSSVQRVFVGMQLAYWNYIYLSVGSLFSIVTLYIGALYKVNIPVLIISTTGVQVLFGFLLLIKLIKMRLFLFKNIMLNINREKNDLFKVGGVFFILQIACMVGWGMDSLLISSTMGVTAVAIYSITQRLFMFLSQPLGIINMPLWAAYADAKNTGDYQFIKKTLKKSLIITVLFGFIGWGILVYFSSYIIAYWSDDEIVVSTTFVILFGLWVLIERIGSAFSMYLNGCGYIKQQVYTALLLVIISLPVKLYYLNEHDIVNMMLSFIIIYTIIHVFMYGFIFRKDVTRYLES